MTTPTQRFTVKKQLSSRNSADGFLAYDANAYTDVRLRRVHSPLSPAQLSSCTDALRVLRRQHSLVKSDHILGITDAGIDDNGLWITVPYYENLQLLKAHPLPIGLTDFHRLAQHFFSALAIIHENHLVHGALTPNSLDVIVSPGSAHRYAIRDFGMRSLLLLAQNPTTLARLPSEPAILAPELFNHKEATPQSDIYMAGQILYYLLAGGHPLVGLSAEDAYPKHLEHGIPLVNTSNKSVPKALAEWLDSLIQPDPQARPASAAEALQALPHYSPLDQLTLGSDALAHGPESTSTDDQQRGKKRRYIIVAAISILCLSLVAGIWFWKFKSTPPATEPAKQESTLISISPVATATVSGERLATTTRRFTIGTSIDSKENQQPWGAGKSKLAKGPDLGSTWRAIIVFKIADILDAYPDDEFDNISSLQNLTARITLKPKADQPGKKTSDYYPLVQFSGIHTKNSRSEYRKAALRITSAVSPHLDTTQGFHYTIDKLDFSKADYLGHVYFTILGSRAPGRGEFLDLDPAAVRLEILPKSFKP